jgi:hypothetical protein
LIGVAKVASTSSGTPRARADLGDRPQVEHAHQRVGRRLDEHRARARADRVRPAARACRRSACDAEPRELPVEQRVRAAVQRVGRDDLVAGAAQESSAQVSAAMPLPRTTQSSAPSSAARRRSSSAWFGLLP